MAHSPITITSKQIQSGNANAISDTSHQRERLAYKAGISPSTSLPPLGETRKTTAEMGANQAKFHISFTKPTPNLGTLE
jgi:hypothetical protein